MFVLENVPLSAYSTMRLGGNAAYLTEINAVSDITPALAWAEERNLPVLMIGGGSNIIWRDEGFAGLVLVSKIQRFEILSQDEENLYLTIGAGEEWDSAVARAVSTGYSGIEELSLIPGTAGATPVQNVGAYGKEIADVLVSVEAYDVAQKKIINIQNADCGFGYRTSRFKTLDKGNFLITAITIHLMKQQLMPPFYSSLQSYLEEHNITDYSPASIRKAVIAIRERKLPNPQFVANCGSFFSNPIIPADQFTQLRAKYPNIVHWQTDGGQYKISAAWLIDQAGLKAHHDAGTGMAIWPQQSLVLVNEHATKTEELLTFRNYLCLKVKELYGIVLEQEPELLP